MEKFAVDLDRVLDEFEYSEDCAEHISVEEHGSKHESSALEVVCKYVQGQPSVDSSSAGILTDRRSEEFVKSSYPLTVSDLGTLRNSKLDNGFVPSEIELKEDISESYVLESSGKLHIEDASKILSVENKCSLSRVNVSGVFSCLNEYITSGGVAFNIREADIHQEFRRDCINTDKEKVEREVNCSSIDSRCVDEMKQPNETFKCDNSPNYMHSPTSNDHEYSSSQTVQKNEIRDTIDEVHPPQSNTYFCMDVSNVTHAPKEGLDLTSDLPVVFNSEEEYDEELLTKYLNGLEDVAVADISLSHKMNESSQQQIICDADKSVPQILSSSTTFPLSSSFTPKSTSVVNITEPIYERLSDKSTFSDYRMIFSTILKNVDNCNSSPFSLVAISEDSFDKTSNKKNPSAIPSHSIEKKINSNGFVKSTHIDTESGSNTPNITSVSCSIPIYSTSVENWDIPLDTTNDSLGDTLLNCTDLTNPCIAKSDSGSYITASTLTNFNVPHSLSSSNMTNTSSSSISSSSVLTANDILSHSSLQSIEYHNSSENSEIISLEKNSIGDISSEHITKINNNEGFPGIINSAASSNIVPTLQSTNLQQSISEDETVNNDAASCVSWCNPTSNSVLLVTSYEDSDKNDTIPEKRKEEPASVEVNVVSSKPTSTGSNVCTRECQENKVCPQDLTSNLTTRIKEETLKGPFHEDNEPANKCLDDSYFQSFTNLRDTNCGGKNSNAEVNTEEIEDMNHNIESETGDFRSTVAAEDLIRKEVQDTFEEVANNPNIPEASDNNVSQTGECSPVSSSGTSESSSVDGSINISPPQEMDCGSNIEYLTEEQNKLGKVSPFWVPDDQAPACMLCGCKFTVLKRRHHCRACGKVFCSKCCCQRYRLEYLNSGEVRVCQMCFETLIRGAEQEQDVSLVSRVGISSHSWNMQVTVGRQPNPNNPMEYCSTVPPLEQVASVPSLPVPSVLVPVGVLKREGSTRLKTDVTKQVMFSDGIRPGGDLTELDASPQECVLRQTDLVARRKTKFSGLITNNSVGVSSRPSKSYEQKQVNLVSSHGLPPLAVLEKGNLKCEDIPPGDMLTIMESLRSETQGPAVFALNRNLFVKVKILNLDCCVNRTCWCFSTIGMSCVGQDEIVIVLEYLPDDTFVPKDIFQHLNDLYHDASRGTLVTEMGHSTFKTSCFLGSPKHGGFLFIRPSFQCLQKIIQPSAPFLVGILIHRWEIPWAKVFPIRLMLRLGAEFRYYPSMLVSVRMREAVYCEIGHTIINLLADFHTMRYTLPSVRGMVIHMQDRHTSILLPKNRYDQVARALNNSNDHVLALAANFSLDADSHLVCIQSPTDDSYRTQAINIHNKPRKVTGASFVVFNGALKISSNLKAKSTIVEDGLMVQITQDTIQELRSCLLKMKDFVVNCGPASSSVPDEIVDLRWVEDDRNFNIGVKSVIDGMLFDGVPSIRVHNGSDFLGKSRFIRWTEVFILQPGNVVDGLINPNDPVDISRIAANLATATCMALCDFLDLLAQGGFARIAVRADIHQDNVGYIVGSEGERLAPIYMKTLDSTLVPVLHHTANMIPNCSPLVLELLFHIMFQ